MKSFGFTLAEVLITLSIIGIVAALTIPQKIGNYVEKRTVVQLKSAYSLVSQAFLSAMAENGEVNNWCEVPITDWNTCSDKIFQTIVPYIKNVALCTRSDDNRCFSPTYKTATDVEWRVTPRTQLLTDSGFSVYIQAYAGDKYPQNWCKATIGEASSNGYSNFYNDCALIYIDINGPARPNVVGRDLFVFKLFKDGLRPGGSPMDTIWTESFENQCLAKNPMNNSGIWCTAWVLINENMDYLHCDDLSWDGKKTCKEK